MGMRRKSILRIVFLIMTGSKPSSMSSMPSAPRCSTCCPCSRAYLSFFSRCCPCSRAYWSCSRWRTSSLEFLELEDMAGLGSHSVDQSVMELARMVRMGRH